MTSPKIHDAKKLNPNTLVQVVPLKAASLMVCGNGPKIKASQRSHVARRAEFNSSGLKRADNSIRKASASENSERHNASVNLIRVESMSARQTNGELRKYVPHEIEVSQTLPDGCAIVLSARVTMIQKHACQETSGRGVDASTSPTLVYNYHLWIQTYPLPRSAESAIIKIKR
jgi:hypothetical protein